MGSLLRTTGRLVGLAGERQTDLHSVANSDKVPRSDYRRGNAQVYSFIFKGESGEGKMGLTF